MPVLKTAYAPGCGDSGSTATGTTPGWGTIAVDPNVIPLGTKLFVPGYGYGVARDTGGAIIGHHIDVWMSRCSDAIRATQYNVPIRVYVH